MFKQALTYVWILSFWTLSAFAPQAGSEKWTATLTLEGTKQPIVLVSDAVYGGYNSVDKKFYFFGKDHMFAHSSNPEYTKIFSDLCTTNGSGKFSFEVNQVMNEVPTNKAALYSGNISFKKKFPLQASFKRIKDEKGLRKSISTSGDFKQLGFILTEEAQKLMTGKFTFVLTSTN
jgi:hypothetical protein